jgi:hypothetical protein
VLFSGVIKKKKERKEKRKKRGWIFFPFEKKKEISMEINWSPGNHMPFLNNAFGHST